MITIDCISLLYPSVHEDLPGKNVWLFNITADPNEHTDLSDRFPNVVRSMLDQLAAFNKTNVPVRFPKFDPNSNPGLHSGVWGPWQ